MGWGIFVLLWGTFAVSTIDNIIKPLIISRGVDLPFVLVLLGVLGGAIAFGFIGIFLGPVLLAVGYALLMEWAAARGRADCRRRRRRRRSPRDAVSGDAAQRIASPRKPSTSATSERSRAAIARDGRQRDAAIAEPPSQPTRARWPVSATAAAARSRAIPSRNGASACTICANTFGVAAITCPPCR